MKIMYIMICFILKKEDSNTSDKFGYSETNPIKTTSIPNAYAYLNRLKTIDGEKIFHRVKS